MREIYGYILITPLDCNKKRLDLFDADENLMRTEIHKSEFECIERANQYYGCACWRYLS